MRTNRHVSIAVSLVQSRECVDSVLFSLVSSVVSLIRQSTPRHGYIFKYIYMGTHIWVPILIYIYHIFGISE